MAEYTKLSSEDVGDYGISKLLNENMPNDKKQSLSTLKKSQESNELELVDLNNKNEISLSYKNKLANSLSLMINRTNQETINNKSRKGKMKMFFYNERNEPLIVLGPDWVNSLVMITLLIIVIIYYFYFFKTLIHSTIRFYGKIISIIHIILYFICFLKNPGIPPNNLWIENYFKNKNNTNNKNYSIKICKDCKIIIESIEHIEHCKICNICVMDMEYHNLWIGKCIGRKNKYYYYCFVFMTGVLIFYLIFAFFSIPFYKENDIKNKI